MVAIRSETSATGRREPRTIRVRTDRSHGQRGEAHAQEQAAQTRERPHHFARFARDHELQLVGRPGPGLDARPEAELDGAKAP